VLEEQKALLHKELENAHRVQDNMFQLDFNQFKVVNASGYFEVMTELGGDMWEFHETKREFLGVIGDVMGHGVASSLISISAKMLFRKRFEDYQFYSQNLGDLCFSLTNDLVAITNQNYFITICLIRIKRNYEMEYLTAGHPPLLIVPADNQRDIVLLHTEQTMLGVFSNIEYSSLSHQLEPGDRILMYTDCLVESFSPNGEPLEIEDIGRVMRHGEKVTPDETLEDIISYRNKFTESDVLSDDLTLVCLEVPEFPPPPVMDEEVTYKHKLKI